MAISTLPPIFQPCNQKLQSVEDPTHSDTLKGWPMYLDSPLAWDGNLFESEDEYTYLLTNNDKLEVEMALAFFKSQSKGTTLLQIYN